MRTLITVVLIFVAVVGAQPLMSAQNATGIHIQVQLTNTDGSPIPMRGVVLLISENPATGEPKRVTTTSDGTVDVNLRPGSYTVESDEPVAFLGKGYEWTQVVDVVSGQRKTLVLTSKNAEVGAITATTKAVDADSIVLYEDHQASVVELWSPAGHAAGFLADAKGLIATNQRSLGEATTVDVQISPAIKVPGRVLVSDRAKDVQIVWVDPQILASMPALPPACDGTAARINSTPDIFTITIPMLGRKDIAWGTPSNLTLMRGSSGGPVFNKNGTLIGLTTDGDLEHEMRAPSHVIPITNLCEPLAAALKKTEGETPPPATRLPVEPAITPSATTAAAASRRSGSGAIEQPRINATDFDLAIVRPMPMGEFRVQSTKPEDFGDWYDYVLQAPPLLYLRAIPKMEESLMMKVGRAAAATQGAVIPPIPHLKASFLKMRAFCGEEEVLPIHPFTIERSPDPKASVKEGLYAFDAASLANCPSVKVMLYSQKEPNKADIRNIDLTLLKP